MLLLTCPNCGDRNVSEFRFNGEYHPRPADPAACSDAEWTDYLFVRDNVMGTQTEWWYHRDGCESWFLAERHTKTNQIVKTYRLQPETAGGDS